MFQGCHVKFKAYKPHKALKRSENLNYHCILCCGNCVNAQLKKNNTYVACRILITFAFSVIFSSKSELNNLRCEK